MINAKRRNMKKQPSMKKQKILKIKRKNFTQTLIEKCINIPTRQDSFINILKHSAVKTIKASAKIL